MTAIHTLIQDHFDQILDLLDEGICITDVRGVILRRRSAVHAVDLPVDALPYVLQGRQFCRRIACHHEIERQ